MCAANNQRNELELVRGLMKMSLLAVIAESINCEMDQIHSSDHLRDDLQMNESSLQDLAARIADIFNTKQPDLNSIMTVAELMKLIIDDEFSDVAEHLADSHRYQQSPLAPAA